MTRACHRHMQCCRESHIPCLGRAVLVSVIWVMQAGSRKATDSQSWGGADARPAALLHHTSLRGSDGHSAAHGGRAGVGPGGPAVGAGRPPHLPAGPAADPARPARPRLSLPLLPLRLHLLCPHRVHCRCAGALCSTPSLIDMSCHRTSAPTMLCALHTLSLLCLA